MRKIVLAFAIIQIAIFSFVSNSFAKDSITIGMRLEPAPGLDPTAGAAAAISQVTWYNIFEGLTRISEKGVVGPMLASSWKVSNDGLTYSFKLLEGVKFHDGSDFSSEDVKFSFERAAGEDSKNKNKKMYRAIESIQTPDSNTVVIKLKKRSALFLFKLAQSTGAIVDAASAENNGTNPIGTGPYKFVKWTKGDSVEMTLFKGHRNASKIKIKDAKFRFINDANAQVNALMTGELDYMPNLSAPEMFSKFESDSKFNAVAGTTEGETILAFNNKAKYLSDVRVRRAIQHAIDRKALINAAMEGHGTPIGSHFAPHGAAYVDLTGMYPFDQNKAKKLLKEAGAENIELSLKLPPPSYARRGGEVIAAMLSEVGITAKIENVEWPVWLDQVYKKKQYDLTIVSHVEPMDIGNYSRKPYYWQYESAAFDKIYSEFEESTSASDQTRLLKAAQRKIAEDAANGFLFQMAKVGVTQKGLKGFWASWPAFINEVAAMSWSN